MNELVEFWEKPAAAKYMIAGWHQWADAGGISSGLPQYLIEQTHAARIGRIKPDGCYLFQIPGTHHLIRPVVKLNEGYRESMQQRRNEFFHASDKELLIFLGEEPHQREGRYADAFFDAVEQLGVERVAAVAGVYGPMPYDKDRDISCVYSLPEMKEQLAQYTVRFSNYEGGATISTYLADRAESRGIEFFAFYAFVPAYAFSTQSTTVEQIAIEDDFKAWYDLMRRLSHMFGLDLDLYDLRERSEELIADWSDKVEHLARTMPHLRVKDYMDQVNANFQEKRFEPLDAVWEEALSDLFDDEEL